MEEEDMQKARVERSKSDDIHLIDVAHTSDSVSCTVLGLSDVYEVEFQQDWFFPTCTCEDFLWRENIRCKHITKVLGECGVSDEDLGNEFNLFIDFQATEKLFFSIVGAIMVPSDGAKQFTGGSSTWSHVMLYASVSF